MSDPTPDRRPLPPPHLSDAARTHLAGPFRTDEWPRDPFDRSAWDARIAAVRAAVERRFDGVEPVAPVDRRDVDGVPVWVATPHTIAQSAVDVHLHGGAFVLGGGEVLRHRAAGAARSRGVETWGVDYRMPPEFPHPAPLDDCLTVYRRALTEHPAGRVTVTAVSAGANLAVAMLVRAAAEGLPMPAALVLLSPAVDLTESGDTFRTNAGVDHVLGSLGSISRLYAGDRPLDDPSVSPLFTELGDLAGLPPTLLQSGTRDVLLSSTVRMHRRLRDARVDAELHVFEAMPHGGFGGDTPEDHEVEAEVRRFLDRYRPDDG